VKRGKPYPDMLFKILESMVLLPREALFVGDGSRDEMAAQKAEIEYMMVNWGFSDHQDAIQSVKVLQRKIIDTL
jgi:phosphoglycolate phosphatase